MKKHLFNRFLSLALAAVMVMGMFPAAGAAPAGLRWEKTDVEVSWDRTDRLAQDDLHGQTAQKPTDLVRVSIVLEDAPTVKAGYATADIGSNTQAIAYDLNLNRVQKVMEKTISAQALDGKALDVVWNLTLVSNIISANVPYGKIGDIKAVEGVRDVVIEKQYETTEVEKHTDTSAGMVGATEVWQTGMTGAGTRVAVIDTGTDTDHQSFDNEAYLYALEQNAAAKGQACGEYMAALDLLDAEEIGKVLKNLNAYERIGRDDASDYYFTEKLPFGANYVDCDLNVTHDCDEQGSHGSHVAGIAAANRFIRQDGGFADARDTVRMSGIAPDAQIITMKIFGNAEGPYDSDYFAAIEDAIWLGCDSVNLSLGSASPGYSDNNLFSDLLDYMATTDTVVVISAGNSGRWAEYTTPTELYADGISFHTSGSPGTYTNSLAVASVDNIGTVGQYTDAASDNSGYYTMSSFSSWGVPGSLELKPEITAPGGQIWSVNGVDPSGEAYEMMSGTSMAAPQVAGMAALAAEYIKSEGLDEKTDLSVRQLAQSLLMSTAEPLREEASGGSYYSILNQGAGLARVDLATAAESYVLVDGMPDGKVKAELGDDAERTGVYEFSFSIHNLNGEDMTYALSADMFTQDLFRDGDGNLYLDACTRSLPAEAAFAMNGGSLETAPDGYSRDLNGDGATNGADADYLLEYLVGNGAELCADGDINGDGSVTSYDAYVLLTKLTGEYRVAVPANGAVTVDVKLELTEETKAFLNEYYTTGAYIEAFVFAEPVTDSEGVPAVTHSIPVLGYYGSWSEPSMYDVGSYLEHRYGMERRTPYLYHINGNQSNVITVDYGDGNKYLFGGNPFAEEDAYLPERNAFNNRSGALLSELRFTQIRNAANAMVTLSDAETGKVYLREELGAYESAYYHANMGQWVNPQHRLALGLGLESFPEGTRLDLTLVTAPEYYCTYDAEGNVTTDWAALKEGAYLTTSFTIDNTAPEIKKVELGENNTLHVTARDNEYIAAVALMNNAGTSVITSSPANQTKRGIELTTELDLSGVFGDQFLVAVFDYAKNVSVYEIELELSSERPYFTGLDRTNVDDDYSISYVGMDADGTSVTLAPASGREPARAAEYVEGYIFEISNDNILYVGSNDDLFNFTELGALDPTGEHQIAGFNDLAYNREDGKLYGLFYSGKNAKAVPYLCTVDVLDGSMEVLGQMPIDANTVAIDGEGNFYSAIYGASQLYTYTSDVCTTGKVTCVGQLDGYRTTTLNSMAWDHNTDELYWAVTSNVATSLLKVDPKTAATELVSSYDFVTVGLFIAYKAENDILAPVGTDSDFVLLERGGVMTGSDPVELTGAEGGRNAAVSVVRPMSMGDVTAKGDVSVTVTVPAEACDSTNGTAWIAFDPAALELVSTAGRTEAFAWKQVEAGRVMIAFADREALAKDAVLSVLNFKALAEGETAVSVIWGEYGERDLELVEDLSVVLPHICPSEHFVDVNVGNWWHEAVDYVVSKGYMNGMNTTHYGPGLTMNRAQFVTVLYRMEGQPAVNNTGVFTDVPASQFYTDAAYWALQSGITTGATADTFNPGGQLTRTELVTFMYRYAKYKGYDTAVSGDLSAYRDANRVLSFAVEPWTWAVSRGVVTGMTADTLAPMALTNRAQAAVIFQRFDTNIAG